MKYSARMLCKEDAVAGVPAALKVQVGLDATLGDVFAHFSGVVLEQGGHYRDVRESRDASSRRG